MDSILKKYIVISIIFIVNFTSATAMTIDQQIAEIKNAPEVKRVELMNQFKRQLILMNQEQRRVAINKLKSDKVNRFPSKEQLPLKSRNFINNIQNSHIEHNIILGRDISIQNSITNNPTPNPIQPIEPNNPAPTTPNPIQPVEPNNPAPTTPNPTQPVEPNNPAPTTPNTTPSQGNHR